MKAKEYFELHEKLIISGYKSEIEWSSDIPPCEDSADFFLRYLWVVCHSGMKAQIAAKVYERILQAIIDGKEILKVFRHELKVKAIKEVLKKQREYFSLFQNAENKIDFLETIPHIGKITKFHLAKDLGISTIKPDRHLVRIAKNYNTNPFDLCKKLSEETGHKLATVDSVLWRSANLGLI